MQTGCPFKITSIFYVLVGHERIARLIEADVHARLQEYRKSGEWFHFDMSNPEHKRAFNQAVRKSILLHHGPIGDWCRTTPERLKARRSELNAENRQRRAERRRREKVQQVLRGYYKLPAGNLLSSCK